ncbi:cupin-like domain-containing protein [Sphingomonas sp.]|uniref:cupin-like domain-containing protein n=1 Tax=Sphingomonas sp. TaxID=28214 RepID=UPI002C640BA1|nr:cupin-like domain-containing protein [Sphingomonas sp.]HTG39766.1 cupin-like domain-containing protein [Sphingomonas sp.]
MAQRFAEVREWRDVDRDRFESEIVPLRRPAVLRGLAGEWPAVAAARQSPRALCDYVRGVDLGKPVPAFLGPPQIKGRFWYREDMRGLNYQQRFAPIAELLDVLLSVEHEAEPPAFYAGAVPISENCPDFARDNATDIAGPGAVARLWVGNRATVSTHFDMSENVAVVVGGRRRFTLFPPEQVRNLYVGPFDFTFAGPPVSMVDLNAPDLARYPRFADAMPFAQQAELEPGDAIYIPYMWWHQVEALSPINMLVNYWWDLSERAWAGSPFRTLMHAIMSIRDLPEHERGVWREWFDHYVFGDGHAAVAHLPAAGRGALGDMTPERAKAVKNYLIEELRR